MRAARFPERDDAIRRLCAAEPALCGDAGGAARASEPFAPGGAAARRPQFPAGWLLLRLLLALSLFVMPTRAQATRDGRGDAGTGAPPVPVPASSGAARAVESVAAVGMTVSDMDRAVEFYTKVLTFEKVSDEEVAGEGYEQLEGVFGLRVRVVRLRLGDETLELTEYLAPKGRPFPADSRSNDLWFQHVAIITRDMDRAYRLLRQNKVQHASTGPQVLPAWNKSAGGIKAFYFKDPDGHALEILQFPPEKGAAKWHAKTDRLFLGIDHTAIVVRDTEASLKFYRDVLGFAVAGESENYGTEQEHLNNVFGARLRITSMRAPSGGPGIEFLEYLAPRDGRPRPSDEHANDLIYWQTGLVTRRVEELAGALRAGRYDFVSPGVVTLSDRALGFSRGFVVRDPDGHAMLLLDAAGDAASK
jgi:catechol 2,3-dioxygenase-like lactoylglutathione lyase family enzyme